MARAALMFSRFTAACWNVLVVNGAAAARVRDPFFTLPTAKSERVSASTSSSAVTLSRIAGPASRNGGLSDVPRAAAGNDASSASNTRSPFASRAWMVQYSTAVKFWMSRSRFTIRWRATLCTRPALAPRLTFFWTNHVSGKPINRSRTRRACWASTRSMSSRPGALRAWASVAGWLAASANAASIAGFVISWKTTRRVFSSGIPAASRMCQAIASPSRSGSVER